VIDDAPLRPDAAHPGQGSFDQHVERLFSVLDPQHVVEALVLAACSQCQAEYAGLLTRDTGPELEIAARTRSYGALGGAPSQRLMLAAGALAAERPIAVAREGEAYPELRRIMRDEGVRGLFGAPLGGEAGGALILTWRDAGLPDGATTRRALDLARCGGIALANARRYTRALEERTFLSALVEQSTAALVVADWQSLAVVMANPAAGQLFGAACEELRAVNLEQVLMPEIGDWMTIRCAGEYSEQIAVLTRSDGSVRPVGLMPSEIRTNAGRFMLLTIRDLDERWHAIQRLVQSEKLGGMRRLTSSIAHHINNPMQAIATSLKLLQQPIDAPRRERYLQLAHEEIERLISLVRRTLAVYQPIQESMRALSVHAVLQSAVEAVAPQLQERGIALEYDLAPRAPRIIGFASHLREVFQNLAQNALEAMPSGGRLVVRTRIEREASGSKQVVIEFSDTGSGIELDRMDTIFEPYGTTHVDRASLGLAISYGIVENHAGRMSVSSSSSGTTFRVILPILDELPGASVSAPAGATLDSSQ
jgi:PAS domain S-box-containing protein